MAHAHTAEPPTSPEAQRKKQAPGRGLWAFLLGLKARFEADRLPVIAAGVAFYAMLAVFPALGALVALYGLALDPKQVTEQLTELAVMLPPQALELITTRLEGLLSDRSALSYGAIAGFALALWSTSAGVRTLMQALNVAYDEQEKRGFFKLLGISLLLTLGAVIGGIVAILSVVVLPAAIDFIGLGPGFAELVSLARWPLVGLLFWFALLIVYRYGPSHERVHWTWVNAGAMVATVLWLAGSALFSWYVSSFANYNKTYGSVAGVVVLLMWFLVSAYAVLIGAEINAEVEKRARKEGVPVDEDHPR